MLKPINLRVNYGRLTDNSRIIEGNNPVISWGGLTSEKNDYQTAFRVTLKTDNNIIFDSGVIESSEQFYKCEVSLPTAKRIVFSVSIAGNNGVLSDEAFDYFYRGDISEINNAKWIEASVDIESLPVYFKKTFSLKEKPLSCSVFLSSAGYYNLLINGKEIETSYLNPAISDYTKTCYYSVLPDLEGIFEGENDITVAVAEGWRRNHGGYLNNHNDPLFFGKPALKFALRLDYEDKTEWIYSDESWNWSAGPVVFSHLFDGEIYDANFSEETFKSVVIGGFDLGKLRPLTIEKIVSKREYEPISIVQLEDKRFVVDFGQNIAGIARLILPKNLKKGDKITLKFMEFLKDDGSLFMENLRNAKATDTYIASGDERDLKIFEPKFLYHGFRYAEVSGVDLLETNDITALAFYTDIDNRSFFKSGSVMLNAIHNLAVATERSNIHSIFTDCPQRDERMGWLNDATVRFEETPYNFEIGRMYPKVINDIIDSQDENGGISDTVPYIYGTKPADPVCSSFLVLAKKAYEFTGNTEKLAEVYENLCAWENCLLDNSENYIVNYSNYGDWASPAYACLKGSLGDGAMSLKVPGTFMSTGYSYYNARLLAEFSKILGKEERQEYYFDLAENIKKAILVKWFDYETAKMCGGEMSCQAFSLWLGILPEEKREEAAKVMRDALVDSDYRFTTGNLCTRYLCDMLIEYGYIDEFYEFLTRDTYPSYGFMLQNEATTVWERFELKTETEMNSHNHPMYASVDYCFYKYLAGISPIDKAFSEVEIKPYFPDKLLSVNSLVETVKGDISVRWVKQFGQLNLFVNIPFNVKANVHFNGETHTVGSGFWKFLKEI